MPMKVDSLLEHLQRVKMRHITSLMIARRKNLKVLMLVVELLQRTLMMNIRAQGDRFRNASHGYGTNKG